MQTTTQVSRKLTRALLATTCLTAATGTAAMATTLNEGTFPAPVDFSNTSPGFLLPVGTDVVTGMLGQLPNEAGFDGTDWFEFQGLTPGATFVLSGSASRDFNSTPVFVELFDSSNHFLGSTGLETGGKVIATGIVPLDGQLVVGTFLESGGTANYSISLTAGVPEPASAGLAGLAIAAGALAWKRRRDS